jgi:membrane dipeptidase
MGATPPDLFDPLFFRPDKKHETVHAPLRVDGHVDLPYYLSFHAPNTLLSKLDDGPFTLQKARKVGVRLFCTALYCEDRFNGDGSFGHFEKLLRFVRDHFDGVTVLQSSDELGKLKKDPEALGTLFLLENADALAQHTDYAAHLKEMGVRAVGLTHAGKNQLGDGNAVLHSGGFTSKGREVVAALRDHGLCIDVAHLHPRCFWQLLDVFDGPIMSSHTGVRDVCHIARNIDMVQVREIFSRQGMVGITFNPEMLVTAGEATVEHVFRHVDTLVQKFGPAGVGVGSDFCGFEVTLQGLEDITGFPLLGEFMREHGYGEDAIARIMGLNWVHFYERLL